MNLNSKVLAYLCPLVIAILFGCLVTPCSGQKRTITVDAGGVVASANFSPLYPKFYGGWTIGAKYLPFRHWFASLMFDKISFAYDRLQTQKSAGIYGSVVYQGDSAIDVMGFDGDVGYSFLDTNFHPIVFAGVKAFNVREAGFGVSDGQSTFVKDSYTHAKIGASLGVGFLWYLDEHLNLLFEWRRSFIEWSDVRLALGLNLP